MNDHLNNQINLVVYAIGQDNFVEPDKEEEERLQVEYNIKKQVQVITCHFN